MKIFDFKSESKDEILKEITEHLGEISGKTVFRLGGKSVFRSDYNMKDNNKFGLLITGSQLMQISSKDKNKQQKSEIMEKFIELILKCEVC